MSIIWKEVFAEEADRVVVVISGQASRCMLQFAQTLYGSVLCAVGALEQGLIELAGCQLAQSNSTYSVNSSNVVQFITSAMCHACLLL